MQIQNQTVQPLHGLAGVVLEAGKEAELSSLLVTLGLTVIEAPAIREVANREHSQAIGMAKEILAGTTDLVIFMTGSGVVHLLEQLADQIDLDSFIESLARTRMIACGPKSMEAFRNLESLSQITLPVRIHGLKCFRWSTSIIPSQAGECSSLERAPCCQSCCRA